MINRRLLEGDGFEPRSRRLASRLEGGPALG
jgi:hypothetical protein